MTRQWTINGRFLTQPLTGVQRYARETIAALDHLIDTGHPLARGLSIELVCPPNEREKLISVSRKSWCARRAVAAGTIGSRSSCLLRQRPAASSVFATSARWPPSRARRLHPRR